MKRRLLYLALAVLVFGFMTQNSKAQLMTITNTTIPTNATSCTNTDIVAFVQVNCINFPLDSVTYTISGSVIDVGVYYQELVICLGAINFTSHTASLGNVPGGTYTVNVTGYLNMGTTTSTMNTVSGPMTVISCCTAVPGISYSGNLCRNDSIIFNSTSIGALSQDWYIDNQFVSSDTTFNYLFDSAGTYDVKIVVNGATCTDSLTQTITVNDLPTVDLGPDAQFCEGDSVLFDAGAGWASVNWSDGSIGQTNYYGSGGDLSAIVTDQNGCRNSDTVLLVETPEPILEFGSEDTLLCNDQFPLTISATGQNYSYLWHDGSTDSIFVLNASGWAACTVVDTTTGCTNYDSIFVIMLICDGLDSENERYLMVYPNPAINSINVVSNSKSLNYKVFDERGVEIFIGTLTEGKTKINLPDIKSGLYFIQTESEQGSLRKSFIVR